MDITIFPGKLSGTVRAIPSKSQAHRLLICAAFADADDQRGVQSPCHPLDQRAERSLVHRQSQPSGDEDRLPFVARPDRTVFDHFAERLVVDVGHHRRRVEQREETAIRRGW